MTTGCVAWAIMVGLLAFLLGIVVGQLWELARIRKGQREIAARRGVGAATR